MKYAKPNGAFSPGQFHLLVCHRIAERAIAEGVKDDPNMREGVCRLLSACLDAIVAGEHTGEVRINQDVDRPIIDALTSLTLILFQSEAFASGKPIRVQFGELWEYVRRMLSCTYEDTLGADVLVQALNVFAEICAYWPDRTRTHIFYATVPLSTNPDVEIIVGISETTMAVLFEHTTPWVKS